MDMDTQILTRYLMQEIKDASGLSLSEMSLALNRYVDIPDKMISQYLNGKKSFGLSRLYAVAQAADENGWRGPTIDYVNYLSQVLLAEDMSKYRAEMSAARKQIKRDQTAAVANMQKAVSALIEKGWSDAEIVTLTKLLSEKLIPPHEREEGGLVHLAELHRLAGLDASDVAPIAWSALQVMSVDVDADAPESGDSALK